MGAVTRTHGAPPARLAWAVVAVIVVGFIVGGIGTIEGWPIFWAGVGIAAFGVVFGRLIRIMEYTEEYAIEGERVEPGTQAWHG